MPIIEANGVDLFYEMAGRGPRVVLTHGAWTDGRTWRAVAGRLGDDYEVVTWDRRGHSRSGGGEGPGSVGQDAADLAALIIGLGVTPVHVIGNSAGGNVVLNLVTSRPDLVITAMVHEPGPNGLIGESGDQRLIELQRDEMDRCAEVERIIAAGDHRRAAEYFMDHVAVGPGAWAQLPEEIRQIMGANAHTAGDDLRDSWNPDSVDLTALANSDTPLLITTGDESPESERAAAHELGARLPRARLVTMSGVGHIPHRTHVDDYVPILVDFMKSARV